MMVNLIKKVFLNRSTWGATYPNGMRCDFRTGYLPHGGHILISYLSSDGVDGHISIKSKSHGRLGGLESCYSASMGVKESFVERLMGLSMIESIEAKIYDGWRTRVYGYVQGMYFDHSYIIGSRDQYRDLSDKLSAILDDARMLSAK